MPVEPISKKASKHLLQVRNPSSSTAVDMSGWRLANSDGGEDEESFVFEPGTVIAPLSRLYIAEDVRGMWSSGEVPEGAFVVGPMSAHIKEAAMHLVDGDGQEVDRL